MIHLQAHPVGGMPALLTAADYSLQPGVDMQDAMLSSMLGQSYPGTATGIPDELPIAEAIGPPSPSRGPEKRLSKQGKICEYAGGCNNAALYGFAGEQAHYCAAHKLENMSRNRRNRCESPNCQKIAVYGLSGETNAHFCPTHRLTGMVAVAFTKCHTVGCIRRATHNLPGLAPTVCAMHKTEGMQDAKGRRCEEPGCMKHPCYGEPGKLSVVCATHKRPGQENVTSHRCSERDCESVAQYTEPGAKTRWCTAHKPEGSFDFKQRSCVQEGCLKRRKFNHPGSLKALLCDQHKAPGMERITENRRRCHADGCLKHATHSMPGDKPQFCATHRTTEMINTTSRRCKEQDCTKQPNYGLEWGKPTHCREHKQVGMFNSVSKRCEEEGCNTIPTYGTPGTKRATRCKVHKNERMVNVRNKKCVANGCNKQPCCNYPGGVPVYCTAHKLDGMENVCSKRCEWENCKKYATYGYGNGARRKYCATHRTDGMVLGSGPAKDRDEGAVPLGTELLRVTDGRRAKGTVTNMWHTPLGQRMYRVEYLTAEDVAEEQVQQQAVANHMRLGAGQPHQGGGYVMQDQLGHAMGYMQHPNMVNVSNNLPQRGQLYHAYG